MRAKIQPHQTPTSPLSGSPLRRTRSHTSSPLRSPCRAGSQTAAISMDAEWGEDSGKDEDGSGGFSHCQKRRNSGLSRRDSFSAHLSEDMCDIENETMKVCLIPLSAVDAQEASLPGWYRQNARVLEEVYELSDALFRSQMASALCKSDASDICSSAARGDVESLIELTMGPYRSLIMLMELVRSISDTSVSQESIESVLVDALAILTRLLKVEVVSLYLYNEEEDAFHGINHTGIEVAAIVATEVFMEDRCMRSTDPYQDTRFSRPYDTFQGFTLRDFICCPVKSRGADRNLGAMLALNKVNEEFSDTDMDFLESCALLCGPVFASAIEREAMRFRNKVEVAVKRCRTITEKDVKDSSFAVVLQKLAATCAQALECEHVLAFIVDREYLVAQARSPYRIPMSANCLRSVPVRTGKPWSGNPTEHEAYNPKYDARGAKVPYVSLTPIVGQDGLPIGVIEARRSTSRGPFCRRFDVAMAQFATIYSQAIESRKLWAMIQHEKGFCDAILHSMSNGVLQIGADFEVNRANQAAASIFRVSNPSDLIGLNVSHLFSSDKVSDAVRRALFLGEQTEILDVQMPTLASARISDASSLTGICKNRRLSDTNALENVVSGRRMSDTSAASRRSSAAQGLNRRQSDMSVSGATQRSSIFAHRSAEELHWETAVNRANITVLPLRAVGHLLEKFGVHWGPSKQDMVQKLANDVQQGKCRLEDRGNTLVRIVDVVVLRIHFPTSNHVIVQKNMGEMLPASKRLPCEDAHQGARRCLNKHFGAQSRYIEVRREERMEYIRERKDSPSYPGLDTLYHKMFIDCTMLPTILTSCDMHCFGMRHVEGESNVHGTVSLEDFSTRVAAKGGKRREGQMCRWGWATLESLIAKDMNVKGSSDFSAFQMSDIESQAHCGSMIVLENLLKEKVTRNTLMRYMDQKLAETLIGEGCAGGSLGGKLSTCTMLFSDIRDFTTMSELLGPVETVNILNDYFTEMVKCIEDHGGMVDKYIGDAIMAGWGIPFAGTRDVDNGVQCALDMLERLEKWNRKRQENHQMTIRIGIGLHTDEVISGNIGTVRRMCYTMVGDGVNLAARLERATRKYGVECIVSDATKRETTLSGIRWRCLDNLAVKGKTEAVLVWEPCLKDDEFVATWQRAQELYRSQNFKDAREIFHQLNDEPSKLYVERCTSFIDDPPPADWDGIWRMHSK